MEDYFYENGDSIPFPKQDYQVPIAFTVANGMCDSAHSLYNPLDAVPVYSDNDSPYSSQEPLHMLNSNLPLGYDDPYFNTHYLTNGLVNSNIRLSTTPDGWMVSSQMIDGRAVARYHPGDKIFQCEMCSIMCNINGMAEHYFANHALHVVLNCPLCPYKHCMAYMIKKHLLRAHPHAVVSSELAHEQQDYYTILFLLHTLKSAVERQSMHTPPPSVSSSSSESQFGAEALTQPSTPSDSQMNGDSTYTCKFCTYTTQRKDLFMRHENIHKDEKQFQCYVCHKDFTRADHVKKHILSRHKEVPYDVLKTRKVQFFKSRRSLTSSPVTGGSPSQSFLVRKTPKKSFRCVQCSWRGNDNWSLKRHCSSHIGAFDCPMCEYNATLEERLASHMFKIHREYICGKCCLHSEDEDEVKKHDCPKKETDAAKKCPRCDEKCESILDMEVHCMIIHRMKLAECNICSKFLTTSQARMCAHYKEVHPELKGSSENNSPDSNSK